jgi:hypothetical protein
MQVHCQIEARVHLAIAACRSMFPDVSSVAAAPSRANLAPMLRQTSATILIA